MSFDLVDTIGTGGCTKSTNPNGDLLCIPQDESHKSPKKQKTQKEGRLEVGHDGEVGLKRETSGSPRKAKHHAEEPHGGKHENFGSEPRQTSHESVKLTSCFGSPSSVPFAS
jgi:hypothetical protein